MDTRQAEKLCVLIVLALFVEGTWSDYLVAYFAHSRFYPFAALLWARPTMSTVYICPCFSIIVSRADLPVPIGILSFSTFVTAALAIAILVWV